ncbi:uncharacterized protein LOC122687690 isoform X2 [Cervus elaphus]|uniref:uncharacterized protein LOC122687690 isoform X1 n=1 Tax=Cervus elaphus TaxID=9860 RepID=UPI001CC30B6C|nr:uncharacterized protein LOC122687690 isoform X1 [Cervus elaphus]XP_043749178.1 uncharacterized protein LOC122687690 isoform X2 [Cervus elaphus]
MVMWSVRSICAFRSPRAPRSWCWASRTCTHTRGMGSWCWASHARTCTHTRGMGSWCWASHARTCMHTRGMGSWCWASRTCTHMGREASVGPRTHAHARTHVGWEAGAGLHTRVYMWDGKLVLGLTHMHAHTWNGKLVLGLTHAHARTHVGREAGAGPHARTCTHTRGAGSWCWALYMRVGAHTWDGKLVLGLARAHACTHMGQEAGAGPCTRVWVHTHGTGSWCWALYMRVGVHTWDGKLVLGLARAHACTHMGQEAGAGPCTRVWVHTHGTGSWCWALYMRVGVHTWDGKLVLGLARAHACTHMGQEAGAGPCTRVWVHTHGMGSWCWALHARVHM